MLSKVKISGQIEVITGLHIGGGGETSMIGAIDSPVVRDPQTLLPMIPGSSLKGKLRTLLSKKFNGVPIEHNEDTIEVRRLFGSSEKNNIVQARLQISDAFYNEAIRRQYDELEIEYTEVKYENTINRKTAEAKPRQIERVIRGSIFDFQMIYNVSNLDEVEADFNNIETAINLLEHDYLGGGGSRGNGRISFNNIEIKTVVGDYDSSKLQLK